MPELHDAFIILGFRYEYEIFILLKETNHIMYGSNLITFQYVRHYTIYVFQYVCD